MQENGMPNIIKSVHTRYINPLTTNVSHHIETSRLICIAYQLTDFYIMVNITR